MLVDPQDNIEHGFFQDSRGSDDSADHSGRMEEQALEPGGPAPAPGVAASPAASSNPAGKERRRSPRYRCSGSAEFRVEGSDVRMWGTLSDVSLHGCYVEMNNTFPVNTRVSLHLEAMGIRAQMQAVVRVSYPFLGMGLCFLKIEPGQLLQLKRLVAAASGHPAASDPVSTLSPTSTSTHSLADVDPHVMLDALTEYFRGNPVLSRTEFYRIAKLTRR